MPRNYNKCCFFFHIDTGRHLCHFFSYLTFGGFGFSTSQICASNGMLCTHFFSCIGRVALDLSKAEEVILQKKGHNFGLIQRQKSVVGPEAMSRPFRQLDYRIISTCSFFLDLIIFLEVGQFLQLTGRLFLFYTNPCQVVCLSLAVARM